MSDELGRGSAPPPDGDGGATADQGTPRAVDVSGDPRARRLITLFLAGPVIWTMHFLTVYLVVEAGCTGDGPGLRVFDPPAPTIITLVATAVAALACLAAAVWAYRQWQADRHERADGRGSESPDPGGSLALAGCLLSLLGVVTVLFVGLPALVLPAC